MAQGQKIGDAYVEIGAKTDKFQKNVQSVGGNISSMFAGIGAGIAGAFAVQKIAAFTREAIELAGVAEGVESAFKGLNDSKLLAQLNVATSGTVSNLDLMQKSVQAVKLGIDKASLPSYFAFATKRAQETGQSVDYLVESIVNGVGRQSSLILDNLGISAVRLAEELDKGGTYAEAVARIINEEMASAGGVIETAAIKQAQLNAEMENLSVELGQRLTPAWVEMQRVAIGALDAISTYLNKDINISSKWQLFFAGATGNMGAFADAVGDAATQQAKANNETEKQSRNQQALNTLLAHNVITQKEAVIVGGKLNEEQHKLLQTNYHKIVAWQKETTTATEAAKTVGYYKEQIKALTDSIDEQSTREGFLKVSKQIDKYKASLEALTKLPERAAISVSELSPTKAPSVGGLLSGAPDLTQTIQPIDTTWTEGIKQSTAAIDAMNAKMLKSETIRMSLQAGFGALADGIIGSFGQAETAAGQFLQTLAQNALQAIAQALAVSIASAIEGGAAAGAATGPAAPFTTPAFIATMVGSVVSAFAAIPAFARGGQSRGGLSLVGEMGPELVNLPSGAMVTPHHQMSSALGAGGGGGGLQVDLYGFLQGDKMYQTTQRGQTRISR